MDDTIISEKVQIERKLFFLDLKENPRGRFLRITEDVKGRRDTIIIPATGLHLFREALEKAIEENDEHPYEGESDYPE
jgi:phenylacetate-coenzyme A ligase PaaK-like adenylate-forming protein